MRRAVHGRAGGEAAADVGAARLDWSAGHPRAMMPRLQVALQQTLRGLPNHRTRLVAARLASHPACMDHANWIARRAVNRDPAVGSVARSARRVVPTAAGLRSPSGDCFGPELRVSSRPIAAHRGHRHWPGPSPARVRPGSSVPFNAQVRGSKLGPAAPPTEWALQDMIAEGAFPDARQLSSVSGGGLKSSKQMPFV